MATSYPGDSLRFSGTPEDNVRIKQKLQSCNTSQSFSSRAGEIMSPVIFIVSFKEPSHTLGFGNGGGVTRAIGSPFSVTKRGRPVLFTSLKRRRQVALNFEIVTVSNINILCSEILIPLFYHGQSYSQQRLGIILSLLSSFACGFSPHEFFFRSECISMHDNLPKSGYSKGEIIIIIVIIVQKNNDIQVIIRNISVFRKFIPTKTLLTKPEIQYCYLNRRG
jgi:hypothetical protein